MTPYSISFVLPMYNEAEAIEDTIEEISIIAKDVSSDYEVIISDDASTDGCYQKAVALSKKYPNLKVVRVGRNTKFGGALANGIKNASKELVLYTDSDLPISLLDIKKALPLIKNADIVTAVSKIKKGDTLKRKIISAGYNALLKLLFGLDINDVNSGFKIYKRSVVKNMVFFSESPFIDAEIFLRAKKIGAKIAEYPIIFRTRRQGVSKVARLEVIIQTFKDMLKLKFTKF